MKIAFNILDSEADSIASHNGFTEGDKSEFVLECFKQFGRKCVISEADKAHSIIAEETKNAQVELAKDAISF